MNVDPGMEGELAKGLEEEKDDPIVLGKRVATDSATLGLTDGIVLADENSGAIVPVGNTAGIIDHFESTEDDPATNGAANTPQKNARKKKLKGGDGEAVVSKAENELAASSSEDRRSQ